MGAIAHDDYASFTQQETVIRLTGGTPLPSAREEQNAVPTVPFPGLRRPLCAHLAHPYRRHTTDRSDHPFDINEQGEIGNTGEAIVDAAVDPHRNYRLKIVDMAALALSSLYPDQTIDGDVVIKGLMGNAEGTVSGGRE